MYMRWRRRLFPITISLGGHWKGPPPPPQLPSQHHQVSPHAECHNKDKVTQTHTESPAPDDDDDEDGKEGRPRRTPVISWLALYLLVQRSVGATTWWAERELLPPPNTWCVLNRHWFGLVCIVFRVFPSSFILGMCEAAERGIGLDQRLLVLSFHCCEAKIRRFFSV